MSSKPLVKPSARARSAEESTSAPSASAHISELKKNFSEGCVPSQNDFATLIDMASAGYLATGMQVDGSAAPGDGLEWKDGKLAVGVDATLKVKDGRLAVNYRCRGGLKETEGWLELQTDASLTVDSVGKLRVNCGSGLEADKSGVSVRYQRGGGLQYTRENGLAYDHSTAMPAGTILLSISKEFVPEGWVKCNGKVFTTPDNDTVLPPRLEPIKCTWGGEEEDFLEFIMKW